MIEDKNKYKKEVYKIILEEYQKADSRMRKKEIKTILYNEPYLSEDQKDEIWSKIIQLEYLKKYGLG